MKMLFFSSDSTEVAELSREFTKAGIPCEVHNPVHHGQEPIPNDAELWIRNDQDCHRALMLCVQQNMGFARRPVPTAEELELDEDVVLC